MAALLFVLYIPRENDDVTDAKNADEVVEKVTSDVQDGDTGQEEISQQDIQVEVQLGQDDSKTENNPVDGKVKLDLNGSIVIDADPNADSAATEDVENNAPGDKAHDDENRIPDTCTEYFTLEEALQGLLDNLEIEKDVWQASECKNYWQVSFIVDAEKVDAVLRRLTLFGLGRIPDTSITLFPSQSHFAGIEESLKKAEKKSDDEDNKEKSTRREFLKSIKARLTVAQVVAGVTANARLTFDYLLLVILASFIAAMGLIENSSVVLVASMLISPLMGPILGWTFGFMVQNRELWVLGVRNELIGLSIAIFIGFFFGLVTGGINVTGMNWGGASSYPTSEMYSRGMTRSLWAGILIALPSGAGVALSILGGNTGSLVGVAISASLLPPAVNAGMLWAFAVITSASGSIQTVQNQYQLTTPSIGNATLNNSTQTVAEDVVSLAPPLCPRLQNNDYEFIYSCHMPTEAFLLGLVSIILTILNIFCIFIMGVLVLKIKEVAPHTAVSEATEMFWKKDVKIARETYKTLKGNEGWDLAKYAKNLAQETKTKLEKGKPKIQPGSYQTYHGKAGSTLYREFLQEIEDNPHYQDVLQRLPNGQRAPALLSQMSLDSEYLTPATTPMTEDEEGLLTPDETPSILRQRSKSGVPYLNQAYPQSVHDPRVSRVSWYDNRMTHYLPDICKLYEETEEDTSKNVIMEYALPEKHEKQRRQVRRMPSCPSRVRVVPCNKNSQGRFKVTMIKDEEHQAQTLSRKGSATLKTPSQNVKQLN